MLVGLESWNVRTMSLVIPWRHFTTVPQSKPYLLAWQSTTTVRAHAQADCECTLKRDTEENCNIRVNQPSPARWVLLIILHFPAWEQVSLGPRNPCCQASSTQGETSCLAWQRWKELLQQLPYNCLFTTQSGGIRRPQADSLSIPRLLARAHWATLGEPTLRVFLLDLTVWSALCSKKHMGPSPPLNLFPFASGSWWALYPGVGWGSSKHRHSKPT